jgi:hypothetical protein
MDRTGDDDKVRLLDSPIHKAASRKLPLTGTERDGRGQLGRPESRDHWAEPIPLGIWAGQPRTDGSSQHDTDTRCSTGSPPNRLAITAGTC